MPKSRSKTKKPGANFDLTTDSSKLKNIKLF